MWLLFREPEYYDEWPLLVGVFGSVDGAKAAVPPQSNAVHWEDVPPHSRAWGGVHRLVFDPPYVGTVYFIDEREVHRA